MTNPDTRALQALADKVEAGGFERGGSLSPKFNAMCREMEACGHKIGFVTLAEMYKDRTLSDHIRALIAGGRWPPA